MHLGNNSCSIDKLLATLCRQGTRLFSGPELKSGGIKERVSRVKNLGGSYIIMNSRVTWYRDLCRKAPVVPLWHARYARTRIYRQSIECTGACQFGRLSSSLLLDFIPLSVKLKKKTKKRRDFISMASRLSEVFFPFFFPFHLKKRKYKNKSIYLWTPCWWRLIDQSISRTQKMPFDGPSLRSRPYRYTSLFLDRFGQLFSSRHASSILFLPIFYCSSPMLAVMSQQSIVDTSPPLTGAGLGWWTMMSRFRWFPFRPSLPSSFHRFQFYFPCLSSPRMRNDLFSAASLGVERVPTACET